LLLSFDAVFPSKLDPVITAVPLTWEMAPPLLFAVLAINSDPVIISDDDFPPPLAMAPPLSCQMNNNETIRATLSEIVRKKAFEE